LGKIKKVKNVKKRQKLKKT